MQRHFATVEDLNGPLVEIIVDVLRTGRRDVTELVRRWRGDWQLRLGERECARTTTRRSSRTTGWLGQRNPTLPVPAETR